MIAKITKIAEIVELDNEDSKDNKDSRKNDSLIFYQSIVAPSLTNPTCGP